MLICSGSMFSILESQTGARCWTSEMLKGVCQKGCTFVMFKRGINFPHHCITAWGCLSLGFLKFVLFLLLLLFFSISILQCCKLLQSEDQDDLNPKSAGRARCRKPRHQLGRGPLGRSSCTSTGWKAKSLFSDVMLKLMPLEHFAQVGRHSLAIPGILHYAVHLRQGCAQKMFPGGTSLQATATFSPVCSRRSGEGKGFTFTQWFCGWAKTLYPLVMSK